MCARRVLKAKSLDTIFVGCKEGEEGGKYTVDSENSERRPFRCVLDIGIIRTTTGNRVFGALKGAVDGGLDIPHSEKRFPGYKKGEFDAEQLRKRIYGDHVDAYMSLLKEKDPEKYKVQFSLWDKTLKDNKVKNVSELVGKVIKSIRKDPLNAEKKTKKWEHKRKGMVITCEGKSWLQNKRLNYKEKKENVQKRIKIAMDKRQKTLE